MPRQAVGPYGLKSGADGTNVTPGRAGEASRCPIGQENRFVFTQPRPEAKVGDQRKPRHRRGSDYRES